MTPDLQVPPPRPPRADALAAARAAMLAEAAKPRGAGWRARMLLVLALTVGVFAVVAVVGSLTGFVSPAVLAARWVTALPVALAGTLTVVAAWTPGKRALRLGAVFLAGGAMLALVLGRAASSYTSATPEWVCTASHIAAAIPAGAVGLLGLRGMAPNRLRAVLAGLGIGTVGALLGELLCERGPMHVGLYHLSAWAVVAAAIVVVASRLTPRSFAP
ncbi:MAG: DUF1109 domain-containing protein [Myxococcota bacterium]